MLGTPNGLLSWLYKNLFVRFFMTHQFSKNTRSDSHCDALLREKNRDFTLWHEHCPDCFIAGCCRCTVALLRFFLVVGRAVPCPPNERASRGTVPRRHGRQCGFRSWRQTPLTTDVWLPRHRTTTLPLWLRLRQGWAYSGKIFYKIMNA